MRWGEDRWEGMGKGKGRKWVRWAAGSLLLLFQQSEAAGPAPDGDIRLQLCRDLCSVYWTVVCCVENSWGAIITHTNGCSLNPLAWAPKETLIWHEDSKQLLLKGCTCKHCIKGVRVLLLCRDTMWGEGVEGRHPMIWGHGLSLVLITAQERFTRCLCCLPHLSSVYPLPAYSHVQFIKPPMF